MGKLFKIIFLNGAILLGIVLFLNFFLLLLNALDNSVFIPFKSDPRAEVANYSDKEFGREIFKDFAGLGVEYWPFVGWRRLEYHGKTTNIDADGIRMHPGYKDNSGLKRAAFFGGSTMWGTGADDNGTIPALVHTLDPDISTINYGSTAYNSRQNLEMLINEFNEGKRFDYVIFYDGVNEIGGCRPRAKAYHHGQESVYRQKLDPSVSGLLTTYFSPTLKLSKKIGEKFFNQQFYDNYVCDENPDKARQVAETMFFNWDLARIVSEKYGATFIGLLQPVAYIGSPETKHLDLDLNDKLGKQYKAVYPIMLSMLKEGNMPWAHDLTASYNGSDYIYVDNCHVSRNGNERIAGRVIDIIDGLQ